MTVSSVVRYCKYDDNSAPWPSGKLHYDVYGLLSWDFTDTAKPDFPLNLLDKKIQDVEHFINISFISFYVYSQEQH